MELEKIAVVEISEREKIKGIIRSKKERQKLGQFEKAVIECPECGSHALEQDYTRAELVCGQCGLVLERDIIDHGPEWRAFDAEERTKRARTGPAMTATVHDKGLSTIIDWRDRDLSGKVISSEARNKFRKLRRWQRRIRVQGGKERGLRGGLSEIERMVSALGLPKIMHETSALIFRKASENNLVRGRSVEGIASVAIYAACRIHQNPRTLDEIAEVARVSRKEIGRNYSFIATKLNLGLPPVSPIDYLPRFCSALKFSTTEVQIISAEILRREKNINIITGRNPSGMAAAVIYRVSQICGARNERTQKEVAKIAKVSEVTIRNILNEMDKKEYLPQM